MGGAARDPRSRVYLELDSELDSDQNRASRFWAAR